MRPLTLARTIAPLGCLITCLLTTSSQAEPPLATAARGILSNRCFACHGPDEEAREGGLRLDDPSSLTTEADSGETPIVPGDISLSELFARVTTDDESMRMPPEDFGPALEKEEIETIRKWIEAGADLPQHWSFIAPQRPAIPKLKSEPAHPIDAFVRAHQNENGLTASDPADRAQILRRLSLDVTGLPPTLTELDAFERDKSPAAYERQVERLLTSPAFGEHWARKWLDLARYADSAGYADDPPRTIWAYRDWVVRAINAGMPIDEFTRKQIAGDLLPGATQDDLIATAFHRNTMTNSEGGTNDEEFRSAAVVDRVNTTMAVWMGVTMACAQCHTHKYDPFTHNEYFQLYAILNSTEDADRRDESPIVELLTDAQRFRQHEITEAVDTIEQRLALPMPADTLQEFDAWTQTVAQPNWHALQPRKFTAESQNAGQIKTDNSILISKQNSVPENDSYIVELSLPRELSALHAIQLSTIPTAELNGFSGLTDHGNFVVTSITAELLPSEATVAPKAQFIRVRLPGKNRILSLAEVQVFSGGENIAASATASQSSTAHNGNAERAIDGNTDGNYDASTTTHTETTTAPWWELELKDSASIDSVVLWNRTDNGLQSRLKGAVVELLDSQRKVIGKADSVSKPKDDNRVVFSSATPLTITGAFADFEQPNFGAKKTIDGLADTGWAIGGQMDQQHQLTLLVDPVLNLQPGSTLRVTIGQNSPHEKHLLGSFKLDASGSKTIADWHQLSPDQRASLAKPGSERNPVIWGSLKELYYRDLADATSGLRKQRQKLASELNSLKPATSVPILREVNPDKQRETFVQIRGNYKSLGERVYPATPAVFHPIESEQPSRLDLANWLTDRKNPLTARVWANRIWESLFGRGIVATSEEFGSQGDLPTHPDLLDWLAVELMDSEWDEKQLIRTIVLSDTYRQDSTASAESIANDPANLWLTRGPGNRLSAEMVRDQALACGELLSSKMYGPPVRPPQPNLGLKAAFGGETDWKTSAGQDRYRRGLYTTWRRSNPYPSMATFDAPSREVCTLRRDSTNTPLQALVTLNDPAFVEAAQAMARRVVSLNCGCSDGEDEHRLRTAFRIATSREPRLAELDALADLLAHARTHFSQRTDAAHRLATDPIGPLPEAFHAQFEYETSGAAVELASWTTVCNTLLNLDETLTKR